ncbi:hypothetical protein B296_00022814 [Ensete ventricosum]|uniref:Uncharacterized protein n=1 Tax=Ensete ventricosum TaxID=4639 RepID=A0A427AG70_ENSVE|nr:hypothetical protein B296_00022814 [Ensete ventricosum]
MGILCLTGMNLKGMKQMSVGQAPHPGPSPLCVVHTMQPRAALETTIEVKQPLKKMKVLAQKPPPSATPNAPTSTAPRKEVLALTTPHKETPLKFYAGREAAGIGTRR